MECVSICGCLMYGIEKDWTKKLFCHNSILLSIQYVNLLLFSVFCLFNIFIIIKKFRLLLSLHSASCSACSLFVIIVASHHIFIYISVLLIKKQMVSIRSHVISSSLPAQTDQSSGIKKTTTTTTITFVSAQIRFEQRTEFATNYHSVMELFMLCNCWYLN